MVTDVFDVTFQGDPFIKMTDEYDVFVGSEGVRINEEPWNRDVISKVFPEDLNICMSQFHFQLNIFYRYPFFPDASL